MAAQPPWPQEYADGGWNEIAEVGSQLPNLIDKRQERQNEIDTRASNRQLHLAEGLLSSWNLAGPHYAENATLDAPHHRSNHADSRQHGFVEIDQGHRWPPQRDSNQYSALSGYASGLAPSTRSVDLPPSALSPPMPGTYEAARNPQGPPVHPQLVRQPHPQPPTTAWHAAPIDQGRFAQIPESSLSRRVESRFGSWSAGDSGLYQHPQEISYARRPSFAHIVDANIRQHGYYGQPHQATEASMQYVPQSGPAPIQYTPYVFEPAPYPHQPPTSSSSFAPLPFIGGTGGPTMPINGQQALYFSGTSASLATASYHSQSTSSHTASSGNHTPRDYVTPQSRDSISPVEYAETVPPSLTPPVLPAPHSFASANEVLLATSAGDVPASQKRSKIGVVSGMSASGTAPTSTDSFVPRLVGRKTGKRLTEEVDIACMQCGITIGKVITRGLAADVEVPHAAHYTCLDCESPGHESDPAATGSDNASNAQGSIKPNRTKTGLMRKKHKRSDDLALTACDVCLRDICFGGVVASQEHQPVSLQVEVVCDACRSKYMRCSDCGGGGGVRLGVGKWRCKELFPPGRKTCSLSHLRLGALSDMFYDVYCTADIPADEIDEVAQVCGAIFSNTMFAGLCIPEVLEQNTSPAQNYQQVAQMAMRGWGAIEPMLRVNLEQAQGIRRYLGFRSCTHNPRKAPRPAEEAPPDYNKTILRFNKDVVGFLLAEWDMPRGHVFLAVVVPWGMGEIYDAGTILIQRLFQKIENDRVSLNSVRAHQGLPPWPMIDIVWTMLFFKRDSRMMNYLSRKRGFSFLEDFLPAHPQVDPNAFPPHRLAYLPPEHQGGWQILVKQRTPGVQDDFFTVRRTSEDALDKKKELKGARARRDAPRK